MAFKHGKGCDFKIDDSAGILRDLSVFVNSVEGLPGDGEVSETTTFGAAGDAKTFIRGLNGAEFSIEGLYDSTATTGPDAVLSGLRTAEASSTFEYFPAGNVTGEAKYTGECFLTSYPLSSPVADVVTFSADFTVSGQIVRSLVP